METLSQKLLDALASLGNSPHEVAAALRQHDIRGVRNTVRFLNPIVRYIQQALALGAFSADLTEPDTLRVALHDGTHVHTVLRQPIKDFLHAFDAGNYPEIEEQGVHGPHAPALPTS